MWKLSATPEYERRHKRYQKKHKKELLAVLDNLDTYLKALQAGTNPQQIKAGFVHPEPMGVVAIDQKGKGKNVAQTRLYVFADPKDEILHLITLGDKRSQAADIKTCKAFVTQLQEENANRKGEEIDDKSE